MSDAGASRLSRRGRWTIGLIGAGIISVFAVANAHLVYVSLASQPACVPHLKAAEDGAGTFRAAKSAC